MHNKATEVSFHDVSLKARLGQVSPSWALRHRFEVGAALVLAGAGEATPEWSQPVSRHIVKESLVGVHGLSPSGEAQKSIQTTGFRSVH